MRKTSSQKARLDTLPPDLEAPLRAFERRASRPPPPPQKREKAFDVLLEEFVARSRGKDALSHQK
ncbi:MAG TPA: hypothetical protein VLD37_06860 [Candidatus Bilamarchaeum sp.]|nr:hypothetical protein [Candidatus Bilamarchaeum sp.]